jgi:hypothetical protein
MTKSESIARINKVLPFLDESQAEQVADFVLFLLDSDEFTDEESKLISQAWAASKGEEAVEWRTIKRTPNV